MQPMNLIQQRGHFLNLINHHKTFPSGRQLLTAFIRDEAFSRRDSPMRPHEGGGYYTNAYVPKTVPPGRPA